MRGDMAKAGAACGYCCSRMRSRRTEYIGHSWGQKGLAKSGQSCQDLADLLSAILGQMSAIFSRLPTAKLADILSASLLAGLLAGCSWSTVAAPNLP